MALGFYWKTNGAIQMNYQVDNNKEYQLLNRVFGWSQRDFLQCNLDAISASFASLEVKQALRKRLYNIEQSRENE